MPGGDWAPFVRGPVLHAGAWGLTGRTQVTWRQTLATQATQGGLPVVPSRRQAGCEPSRPRSAAFCQKEPEAAASGSPGDMGLRLALGLTGQRGRRAQGAALHARVSAVRAGKVQKDLGLLLGLHLY